MVMMVVMTRDCDRNQINHSQLRLCSIARGLLFVVWSTGQMSNTELCATQKAFCVA